MFLFFWFLVVLGIESAEILFDSFWRVECINVGGF